MTLSLKGLLLGAVLFPIVWLAFLVAYAWRIGVRTPGSSTDVVSLATHSIGPVFWLTLVVMLGVGCLIVSHWQR